MTEDLNLSDIEESITAPIEVKKISIDGIRDWFSELVPDVWNVLVKACIAVVVLLVGMKVIAVIRKIVRKSLEKAGLEKGVVQFLDSVLRIVLYIVLLLLILNQFGVQTTSIVAVLGSAGLAAGLALQGSLANFAGGVLILVLKPFKVGDYIIEDTHKNEGEVVEISIIYTRLKTVDNKIIVVPNGTLANSSMTNVTHQEKRRVDLQVGISYGADLKKAKAVLHEVLQNEKKRCAKEEMQVFVSELADSSVQLGVRVWVRSEDYWEVKWRLTENIKLALDENEIEIPYPQMEVSVKNVSPKS
ncbi:MAG: mechanosensitive ion channel [Eubacterium sp.]|nr:mechanosensitive ion channel [Eubacterium sp.]